MEDRSAIFLAANLSPMPHLAASLPSTAALLPLLSGVSGNRTPDLPLTISEQSLRHEAALLNKLVPAPSSGVAL